MSSSDISYLLVDSSNIEMTGQVILVTHASSPLGLAVACEIKRRGGEPFLHGRSERALAKAAAVLGGAKYHACQPWEGNAHHQLLQEVISTCGQLDGIVNIVDCDSLRVRRNAQDIDLWLGETIRFSALLYWKMIELLPVGGAIVNVAQTRKPASDMGLIVRTALCGLTDKVAKAPAINPVRVNHVDYCNAPAGGVRATNHRAAVVEQIVFWASRKSLPISGQRCELRGRFS